MTIENLKALGIDPTELEGKIIERTSEMLTERVICEEGSESEFNHRLKKLMHKRIDAAVDAVTANHAQPSIEQYLAKVQLRETNRWGEPKREPVPFVEYVTDRAERYLAEDVNKAGKSEREARRDNDYGWKVYTKRAVWIIEKHLAKRISEALADSLNLLNEAVKGGLEAAVKDRLEALNNELRVTFGSDEGKAK